MNTLNSVRHAAATAAVICTFSFVVSEAGGAPMASSGDLGEAEAPAPEAISLLAQALAEGGDPLAALADARAQRELALAFGYDAQPAQSRRRPPPARDHRRGPEDWSRSRNVQDACDRAVSGRRAYSECLEAARWADFRPTRLIRRKRPVNHG